MEEGVFVHSGREGGEGGFGAGFFEFGEGGGDAAADGIGDSGLGGVRFVAESGQDDSLVGRFLQVESEGASGLGFEVAAADDFGEESAGDFIGLICGGGEDGFSALAEGGDEQASAFMRGDGFFGCGEFQHLGSLVFVLQEKRGGWRIIALLPAGAGQLGGDLRLHMFSEKSEIL